MSSPTSEVSPRDRSFLRQALRLASLGAGHVSPNPLVGCVIVSGAAAGDTDADVVGEGCHRQAGGPHAEINALAAAGARARGGTAYVTLEPCAHHGRTPPCVDALKVSGIATVVFGAHDPHPEAGGGAARLSELGIAVRGPDAEISRSVRAQNRPFFAAIERGRPWVLAKWAMTLDGRLATRTGQSQWITGPHARARAHALRAAADAVLVGSGTALADDPLLTARPEPNPSGELSRQPLRIVVDARGRLPATARLLASASPAAPVLLATARQRPDLVAPGVTLWRFPSRAAGGVPLEALFTRLTAERQVQSVLVEGGSAVLGELFDAGLVDEVCVFVAPRLVGGAEALGPIGGVGVPTLTAAWRLVEPIVEYFHEPDAESAGAGESSPGWLIRGRVQAGGA